MRARKHFGVEHVAEWLTERTALLPLSEAQAQLLAQQTQPVVFTGGRLYPPLGEPVLREDELLLILRGHIAVELPLDVEHLAWAEVSQLPELAAGDFVGEVAFLDASGAARTVMLHALDEIAAAALSRQAVQALVQEQPDVVVRLMSAVTVSLSQQLRAIQNRMALATQLLRASPGATPEPLAAVARG